MVYIIIGVSGCGKTTIGRMLAKRLAINFYDADDFHSENNINKMKNFYTSTLTYFDGFRSERLPANLIQAQLDYFWAHGYERLDAPRGVFFHMRWDKKDNEVV